MRIEYQIDVAYARQSLEAVALSESGAQWLRATLECSGHARAPLAFDDRGRPVDFGTDLCRGDRVRFVTDAAALVVPMDGDGVVTGGTTR